MHNVETLSSMFVLDRHFSNIHYTKLSMQKGRSLLDVKKLVVFFAINMITEVAWVMQVLFFSTIIANLVGRTLPKWKMFAIKSPTFLMYLGFVKLAAAPLCFVYLKSSDRWHSDAGATGEHSFWCHVLAMGSCIVSKHAAKACPNA